MRIEQVTPFDEEGVVIELQDIVADMEGINRAVGTGEPIDLTQAILYLRRVAWGVMTLSKLILGPDREERDG